LNEKYANTYRLRVSGVGILLNWGPEREVTPGDVDGRKGKWKPFVSLLGMYGME
jgi:hypothetical protein